MSAKHLSRITCSSLLLVFAAGAAGHGLIVDPPSRNAYCGLIEKPNNATTNACKEAFANDPNGGYQFMSVLTHDIGRKGARSNNVCGFDSETWNGEATPWDQPTNWPTNNLTPGEMTFTWNISWGPHFDDTEEFVYYITKPDFVFQLGVPLTWDDFEETAFCDEKYDDKTPDANPLVVADKTNALFHTTCTIPARSGRHVIYAEWGRNPYTYERFHGCVDAVFDGTYPEPTPLPTPEPTPIPTPVVTPPGVSPTPTSIPTSTPTPEQGAGAKCEHIINNSWAGGFQGAIRIINTGSEPLFGWEVTWSYSDGSEIYSAWNASVTEGKPYIASNLGWNATIDPGQTVEFGFTGNGGGIATPVTGAICQ